MHNNNLNTSIYIYITILYPIINNLSSSLYYSVDHKIFSNHCYWIDQLSREQGKNLAKLKY